MLMRNIKSCANWGCWLGSISMVSNFALVQCTCMYVSPLHSSTAWLHYSFDCFQATNYYFLCLVFDSQSRAITAAGSINDKYIMSRHCVGYLKRFGWLVDIYKVEDVSSQSKPNTHWRTGGSLTVEKQKLTCACLFLLSGFMSISSTEASEAGKNIKFTFK